MASVHRPNTPFGGSLAYLLMNLPLGIAGFTVLLTLITTGIGTAIVWVGLPLAAFAILLARGAARVERARVYALLDTFIPLPYLPLPIGSQRLRWKARLRHLSTWRDLAYFFVLFPVGVIEFVLVVTFWSTSLNVIWGYAGQFSMAQVGLGGLTAYVLAILVSKQGWGIIPAILVGVGAMLAFRERGKGGE